MRKRIIDKLEMNNEIDVSLHSVAIAYIKHRIYINNLEIEEQLKFSSNMSCLKKERFKFITLDIN